MSCKHSVVFLLDTWYSSLVLFSSVFDARQFTFPTDFSVRLAGGHAPNEGRVEVYYKGRWGTICNTDSSSDWKQYDADFVCKQLGFSDGAYSSLGNYARGSTPVIFTNFLCRSSDTNFAACRHDSLDNPSYCSTISAKVAGAACDGPPGPLPTPQSLAGRLTIIYFENLVVMETQITSQYTG